MKRSSKRIPLRRRPPVEQDRIAAWVRQKIVKGAWRPRDRMPSRETLLARFKVSSPTMQRAMDQLLEDGFIVAHGPRGTFVAERPPHQYRIALAFAPEQQDPSGWSNLWTSLLAAARKVSRPGPFRFEPYLGIDRHLDSEGAWRLQRDIERGALAGVIMDHYSVRQANALGLPRKGIPAVSVLTATGSAKMPALYPDLDAFFDGALARLKVAGCSRIAAVVLGNNDMWSGLPELERRYAAAGVEWRPEWVQGVPTMPGFDWGAHAARLLMAGPRGQRPDGLIVADDNLAAPVASGLQASGVRVPRDLRVVAQANWPTLPDVALDFEWFGFDMCDLLDRAVRTIHDLHVGGAVARQFRLPPVALPVS